MNTQETLRAVRASLRARVLVLFAAALLSLQMTALFAQSTRQGEGQGRNSQPGELQRNPKPDDQPGSGRMEEPNPAAANPGARVMNELPQRGPGDSQPPVDLTRRQGIGRQTNRNPEGPPAGSHLHLLLRLTEGGGAELLAATEVPGEVVMSDDPAGDLVYEVARGNEVLAVQALADPFERRGFPQPGAEVEKHHFGRATSATVVVKVPGAGLESAELDALTLRFYEMLPGEAVEKLDGETLDRLRRERRLQMKLDIPGSILGPQIRQKGQRLNR